MARFVRVAHDDAPRYGVLDEAEVALIEPHPFARHRLTGERLPLDGLRLLAPVIPSKIVGVTSAIEPPPTDPADALLFLKPSSSVVGPGEPIRVPAGHTVEHGAGLAVVVGALLQRVDPQQALAGILGYTCVNDVTLGDLRCAEGPSLRAKGLDSFCPVGPAIATDLDTRDLRVRCVVDGDVRHDGSTADLATDVATLVSHVSQVVTLLPSDIVLTGTPAGVGPITAGQRVRVEIDGIGALENLVVDRDAVGDRPNGSAAP